MRKNYDNYLIFTNMTDLCGFMQKPQYVIVKMEPIKGIANEDIMKVTYRYTEKEEA